MADKRNAPRTAMPTRVPVLPVRDTVHFPSLINTLHVIREPSVKALRRSEESDHMVLVLSQRDMAIEEPRAADLFRVGTLSQALQSSPMPDASLRVVLRGVTRARATKVFGKDGLFWADVVWLEENPIEGPESEALIRACIDGFTRIVQLNRDIPPETLDSVMHAEKPGLLADTILHHMPLRSAEKQALLEELDQRARLEKTLAALRQEEQVLELANHIRERVEREINDSQREFYLREQLRVIQSELHEREHRVGEYDEYLELIQNAQMPPEAEEKAMSELRRLDRTPAASPEGMVLRNYLDTLVNLPWSKGTRDSIDLAAAAELLDVRHYGLPKVKDRILDFLAVRQLKDTLRGPILCFVGPPGVGKTSLGRSIADAMGRKFCRLSLGGVRDEAEIRGHRRTYVGSMPGRVLQGLRQCGSRNPVMVLDELDKLGRDSLGDPTSALLEALDPEQNCRFSDHYVEAPFDLSAVMFVGTANVIENIPAPLRDRMEIIPFSGYSEQERCAIGRSFLFPEALKEHGLTPEQVELPDCSLDLVVREYTREAGVRELNRKLAALCRKVARKIALGETQHVCLDEFELRASLGRPRYSGSLVTLKDEIGVARGLVVSELGGDVIPIEVSVTDPLGPAPELKLTGNLGDVMKESGQAALTYVQSVYGVLRKDVHIHVPEGAIPKDGPSAGVTIATALASVWLNRSVRGSVAMTGEVTLRGRVLPVGGVREKVLAAQRTGISAVILPRGNEPDLCDVPADQLKGLDIHLVDDLQEAIELALLP